MNIGRLYTYNYSRLLHETKELTEWFIEIEEDTPLVLLELYKPASFSGVVKSYKVLTSNGLVGWISGLEEFFRELS